MSGVCGPWDLICDEMKRPGCRPLPSILACEIGGAPLWLPKIDSLAILSDLRCRHLTEET